MSDTSERFDELVQDHQLFHTEYQIDHFIIGSAGTPYAQYQQALRELVKRYRGLKQLEVQLCRNRLERQKLQARLDCDDVETAIDRELLRLEVMEKQMQEEETERSMRHTKREFTRFFRIADSLKTKLGEIDDKRRYELEEEKWYHRARALVASDLLTAGHITGGTVSLLQGLDPEPRGRLIDELTHDRAALLDWFQLQDQTPKLPSSRIPLEHFDPLAEVE